MIALALITLGTVGAIVNAPNPTSNVRVDELAGRVIYWVKNPGPDSVTVRVRVVKWNWAKVRERLPFDIVLKPDESKTVYFHPVDKRVPHFGKTVEMRCDYLVNGVLVGGHGSGPAPYYSGPTVAIQRASLFSETWEIWLSCPSPTDEIQRIDVKHGKLPLYSSSGRSILVKPQVLAILPKRTQTLSWSVKWRPSPWAPWMIEKGSYKADLQSIPKQ